MGAAVPGKEGAAGSLKEKLDKRVEKLRANLKKRLPELKCVLLTGRDRVFGPLAVVVRTISIVTHYAAHFLHRTDYGSSPSTVRVAQAESLPRIRADKRHMQKQIPQRSVC